MVWSSVFVDFCFRPHVLYLVLFALLWMLLTVSNYCTQFTLSFETAIFVGICCLQFRCLWLFAL